MAPERVAGPFAWRKVAGAILRRASSDTHPSAVRHPAALRVLLSWPNLGAVTCRSRSSRSLRQRGTQPAQLGAERQSPVELGLPSPPKRPMFPRARRRYKRGLSFPRRSANPVRRSLGIQTPHDAFGSSVQPLRPTMLAGERGSTCADTASETFLRLVEGIRGRAAGRSPVQASPPVQSARISRVETTPTQLHPLVPSR